MGLTLSAFALLALTGGTLRWLRLTQRRRPGWLWPFHAVVGSMMVLLIVGLLTIGIVGTLGEYGNLGHSWHLPAGGTVVGLAIASAWSASRIRAGVSSARFLHLVLNGGLGIALLTTGLTGWQVVQKYLP